MNFTYQILYWRDIPAQVKVRSGRQRIARSLSPRFQDAIDEAAMRARATGSDEYLEDWHSTEWQAGEGDPDLFADTQVAEIEAAYPPERLESILENKGYA